MSAPGTADHQIGTATAGRRSAIIPAVILGDTIGYPINGVRAGHVQQLLGTVSGVPANGDLYPDRADKCREAGLHSALGQHFLATLSAFEPDDMQRAPVALAGARLLELAGDGETSPHGALRFPGRPLMGAVKQWRTEFPWEPEDFTRGKRPSKGASPAVTGLAFIASGRAASDPMLVDFVRLTHGGLLALSAAYAGARLAELLLETPGGKKIDASGILATLIDDLAREEARLIDLFGAQWREWEWDIPASKLSDALRPLPSLLREENDKLAESTLVRGIREFGSDQDVAHATNGFAAAAIPWAIYRALGSHSPAAALDIVSNEGGEACTVAALVAGLMAARYGIEHFPSDWFASAKADRIAREAATHTAGWPDRWLAFERTATTRESNKRAELLKRRGEPAPKKKAHAASDKYNPTPTAPEPHDEPFAPPPPEWLTRINPEDPLEKHKLKESRGKKRIGWQEDRRKGERHRGED